MAGHNSESMQLPETDADFIQGGVSIIASSRTSENIPVMGRAVGCRVSVDRRTVRLLFRTSSVSDFLEGIRSSRQIAAVFGLPSTHRTIQLKGTDAAVVPVQKPDLQIAGRYVDRIAAEVSPLGFDEEHTRAIVYC